MSCGIIIKEEYHLYRYNKYLVERDYIARSHLSRFRLLWTIYTIYVELISRYEYSHMNF